MPLLKKRVFERVRLPEGLRDDEEVFYCETTNEIFRDYEEFSERMFLCNSMVWTCALTGKSSLTYSEAVESEETARKYLKEFPNELKIPLLFLASKTKRTSFLDMSDDVFCFIKDRYFIGENVESSFTTNKWKDSHILQVIAPTPEAIKKATKSPPKNGNTEKVFHPSAFLFKYEIEHLDAYDQDISEIMIVDHNQLKRKKGSFSRERCKLFLKQYVEQDERGVLVIKPSVLEEFGINKMSFEQIFAGPLPAFESSTKFNKAINGKKPSKQQTLNKYLTQNGQPQTPQSKNNLLELLRKREEEFKLQKQQKEEERQALKQKKKEDNIKIAAYLKEWYRTREDLELEDFKILPEVVPVKCKVPDKYVGEMLMILEFVDSFSKLLSAQNFFPGGLTFELVERALTEKEVAGPLIDIIQMLLTALFNVQDEEASQYRTQIEKTSEIKKEDVPENLSLYEATRLATQAYQWSNYHQGLPLSRLPLYSLTVSEILRLHLLSSGARINEVGAKWRYQQRGGYGSEDDPGLYLRLHQPHILRALSIHNVVQLSINDKLKILSCLINQLLTYADVRDVIEERIEKSRTTKLELRTLQTAERKRDQEYLTAKMKLKKQMKDDNTIKESDLEKLDREAERKKAENERKIEKLIKAAHDKQVLIGLDRAYRKYFKLDSIPGVFINFEEPHPGSCLSEPVKHLPHLVGADKAATISHIKNVCDDLNSSDKENNPDESKKTPNGSVNRTTADPSELLTCSADPRNCVVHSSNPERRKWYFLEKHEQLDELIDSLNRRGVRETELASVLQADKEVLYQLISQTPVTELNPEIQVFDSEPKPLTKAQEKRKSRYEDANLGYSVELAPEEVLHSAMVDNILEMEEKIYAGNLGCLRVKDRDAWRKCLLDRNYDKLEKTIVKQERENGKHLKVKKEAESRSSTPEIEVKCFEDPGKFLGATLEVESEDSDNEILLTQTEALSKAISSLAIAMAQVGRAVDRKYLKKPLGSADVSKNDVKKKEEFNVLERWEQSLLGCTSFCQVFLHYGTLDSCVMWSRSALLARCRICRRQKDSENMLLCDSCNLGHHLYCLKPKLTSVPVGDWFCNRCLLEREKQKKLESPEPSPQKKRKIFNEESSEDEEEVGEENSESDMEEDSEVLAEKIELCKVCGSNGELLSCDTCTNHYHIECVRPILRRAPRGAWTCTSCKIGKQKKEDDSDNEEQLVLRKTHRTDGGRKDLPLHNAALQELLVEVMKHPDAWPFLRPVQKNEVPDYYDIIAKPMDFGTLKYKLNMGDYPDDASFMSHAVLIFENCNTYNRSNDEVYKCGVRLLRQFIKKCKELGLKLPEEMENEYEVEDDQPKSKKRRLK